MTIKEKLKICRFAEKVYQEQNVSRKDDGTYKKKKGLNIQAVCQQKFGSKLGGIRVPRLLKTARKMKWAELTESQQARMHHLTDNLKQSMGLKEYVKGWKCLSQAEVQEAGKIQRWNIPQQVLKDSLCMLMYILTFSSNLQMCLAHTPPHSLCHGPLEELHDAMVAHCEGRTAVTQKRDRVLSRQLAGSRTLFAGFQCLILS